MLLLKITPWGRDAALGNIWHFRSWLARWGGWSWIMFLLIGTALVSIGFPRIALAGVAGAMFNIYWGILLAQLATTLAAAPGYYYAHFWGRDLAMRKMGNRLQHLDGMLENHGLKVFLLIRLCPVGNAFLTNCIAGVSAVRFSDFMLATFLGYLPETIIFALLGGSFAGNYDLRLWSSIGLLILFTLGFIWFFKKSAFAAKIQSIMREEKS